MIPLVYSGVQFRSFELFDKVFQGNVIVVFFIDRMDLFDLLFTFHRNKDQTFGVVDLFNAVVGHDGNAFFGSHHDQDRFDVGGSADDVGSIAGLVVEVHELRVTVVVGKFRRRHVDDGFGIEVASFQIFPLAQRMGGI